VIEVILPPKGYLARRFIELLAMFLKGVEIKEDKLVLINCTDFHQSLQSLLESISELKRRYIFLTGNDRRYVVSKVAKLLGMDASSRVTAIDLLKALANVVKKEAEGKCITKSLTNAAATINILKVNFYEYGRAYLVKPNGKYVTIDRLPIIVQLLGMLGILIADVGMIIEENTHYYALPPEGISREVLAIHKDYILKHFKLTQEVLRRYFNAPRALLILKLATELVKVGCEEDSVVAELIGIQEKGNRATAMSIEPVSTEGLVYLLFSIGADRAKEIAVKLGILSDIAIRSQDKTREVVTRIATYMLTYSRTNSLDALYSAIALIKRLSDHVRIGTKEFSCLIDGLTEAGVNRPAEWLSRLSALMSELMKEG